MQDRGKMKIQHTQKKYSIARSGSAESSGLLKTVLEEFWLNRWNLTELYFWQKLHSFRFAAVFFRALYKWLNEIC